MHILDYLLLKILEMEAKTGKNLDELTDDVKHCPVVKLSGLLRNDVFGVGIEFYDDYSEERRELLYHYIRYNFIHITALIIQLLKRETPKLLHLPAIVKTIMKYLTPVEI